MSDLEKSILDFEIKSQRKILSSSSELAVAALSILKLCVSSSHSISDVQHNLMRVAKRLKKCSPYDVVVGNCCDRVLNTVNEEFEKSMKPSEFYSVKRSVSLLELFAQPLNPMKSDSFDEDRSFKSSICRVIEDYIDEIPQYFQDIAKSAKDFIHSGDIIMTIGKSKSTFAFFQRAVEKQRKFSVIIPEHAPSYDGITTAKELRKIGVDVIVIPDSAVYAVMPKITAVIVPCRGVLADGNLICTNYVLPIAMAAKKHAVPFIVLYWRWKLTEKFLKPGDSFTQLVSPLNAAGGNYDFTGKLQIFSPEGECVPGNLVKIYINEEGPHGPADVFPLMQSIYHQIE